MFGQPGSTETPAVEQPVVPPPAEATSTEAKPEPTPQDVVTALIAEDERLMGQMDLVKTQRLDGSSIVFFPRPLSKPDYGYVAYGADSSRGLVYVRLQDIGTDVAEQSKTMGRLRLSSKESVLSDAIVHPIERPEQMDEWTQEFTKVRDAGEQRAKELRERTEFQKSLPGKAMDLIAQHVQPTLPTAQGTNQ